jgi:hypothetical protein
MVNFLVSSTLDLGFGTIKLVIVAFSSKRGIKSKDLLVRIGIMCPRPSAVTFLPADLFQ